MKELAAHLPLKFEKLTKLILHPEGFNNQDERKESLNKREFSEAAQFVENAICSLDDQVFEALDTDHNGFLDA